MNYNDAGFLVLFALIVGLGCLVYWRQFIDRPAEAPVALTTCPRQDHEATLPSQKAHRTHARKDGTCSYCGSLSEALFLDAVLSGCSLGPTDKNYKVYIDVPNSRAGRTIIVGSANHPAHGFERLEQKHLHIAAESGWERAYFNERLDKGDYILLGTSPETNRCKFYFQHLSAEGKARFIEAVNSGVARVGMPGYFYSMPFFMKKAEAA